MSTLQEQAPDILTRESWQAGLQYYDFLLRATFRADGSGEHEYGEAQGMRSTVTFRYHIVDSTHIHFEFTGIEYGEEEAEGLEEADASRTVAFELEEGPFTVEEPYEVKEYCYRLRFANDPFPDTPSDDKDPFLTYYA
ncbi:hypothetical protein [Ktedonospora formicarum]|uniref:Uncharacterized protein n=1 Tax=Ktedonospora formicarum TaxID=2778364 RepID=A0A8J3I3J2_9CHLR|nr:hypothetical protein [Ktedonospora formicarum]GHO49502.1 hypothetical protein KSX_76650 [Ktedonospora formicarum]